MTTVLIAPPRVSGRSGPWGVPLCVRRTRVFTLRNVP